MHDSEHQPLSRTFVAVLILAAGIAIVLITLSLIHVREIHEHNAARQAETRTWVPVTATIVEATTTEVHKARQTYVHCDQIRVGYRYQQQDYVSTLELFEPCPIESHHGQDYQRIVQMNYPAQARITILVNPAQPQLVRDMAYQGHGES